MWNFDDDKLIGSISMQILKVGNKLNAKIDKIDEITNLIYLDLVNNQIIKIENLPQSLIDLYLDHNHIQALANLPRSITSMGISNNKINKIDFISTNYTQSGGCGGNFSLFQDLKSWRYS